MIAEEERRVGDGEGAELIAEAHAKRRMEYNQVIPNQSCLTTVKMQAPLSWRQCGCKSPGAQEDKTGDRERKIVYSPRPPQHAHK